MTIYDPVWSILIVPGDYVRLLQFPLFFHLDERKGNCYHLMWWRLRCYADTYLDISGQLLTSNKGSISMSLLFFGWYSRAVEVHKATRSIRIPVIAHFSRRHVETSTASLVTLPTVQRCRYWYYLQQKLRHIGLRTSERFSTVGINIHTDWTYRPTHTPTLSYFAPSMRSYWIVSRGYRLWWQSP